MAKNNHNAQNNKKGEKHYIRILGTDIDGEKSLLYGLAKIKGLNVMTANGVCHILKLGKNKKIKDLTDKDLEKIENYLKNMKGMPSWLMNNRDSYDDGSNKHILSKDLDFNLMLIKRRLFRIRSYRGVRLKEGLLVRGQRTKSNFRKKKLNKRK